jgi:hypothetical protein
MVCECQVYNRDMIIMPSQEPMIGTQRKDSHTVVGALLGVTGQTLEMCAAESDDVTRSCYLGFLRAMGQCMQLADRVSDGGSAQILPQTCEMIAYPHQD